MGNRSTKRAARAVAGLGCALVIVTLPAPSAAAAAEGALTELSGPGSCLTENATATPDCTPLAGVPSESVPAGDMTGLAFSPDGRHAYLATQRPSGKLNGGPAMLYVLMRDTATGRLFQPTGAGTCFAEDGLSPCARVRALGTVPRVQVSGDGRFVYVGSGSGIAVFRRDRESGALTQPSGPRGCVNGSGRGSCTRVRGLNYGSDMAMLPGSRILMVQRGSTFYLLRRDARTGALRWTGEPGGCVASRKQSRCTRIPEIADIPAFSADGRLAFAADDNSDGVRAFRSDPRSGLLTEVGGPVCARRGTPQGPGRCGFVSGGFRQVTPSPDARHLYLTDTVLDEVVVFSVDPRGTVIAAGGPFGCTRGSSDPPCEGETGAGSLNITSDGRFAYQLLGGLVLAFARDPASGALGLLPPPDSCLSDMGKSGCTPMRNIRDPWRSRLSPDGRQLYVISSVRSSPPRNNLVVFTRTEPASP